jgi:hypothetical protein
MNEEEMTTRSEIKLSHLRRDRFFSGLTARLLFLLLLIADLAWGLYALFFFFMLNVAALVTFWKVQAFKDVAACYWLSLKRASVCGISLFLALFSPGFGIMIACTYFLMYDKEGLEEVVPSSLQTQFKEFFSSSDGENN